MASLRDLSIPRKIVAIAMIISTSALLLAGAALISYDFFAARRDLGSNTTVFAQIVAANATAAVTFNDQPAAVDILNSLRSEPSIVSSCIYKGAELFAERTRAGGRPCPQHGVGAEQEEPGFTVGSSPILLKGEQIGSVRLLATLAPVYAMLRIAIGVLAGIFIVSVLFALGLSSRLHKVVSAKRLPHLHIFPEDVGTWFSAEDIPIFVDRAKLGAASGLSARVAALIEDEVFHPAAHRVADADSRLETGIVDVVRLGVEHIDEVFVIDGKRDSTRHAELMPLRDKFSVLIENLDSGVAAIAHEDPPSFVHLDAMHR